MLVHACLRVPRAREHVCVRVRMRTCRQRRTATAKAEADSKSDLSDATDGEADALTSVRPSLPANRDQRHRRRSAAQPMLRRMEAPCR